MKMLSKIIIVALFMVVTNYPISSYANLHAGGDWYWQNPFIVGLDFFGIWGSSGSNVFAVGESGTIVHYDTTSWSPMMSGSTENLHGVWGS